jgi:putative DNA primase/helicase
LPIAVVSITHFSKGTGQSAVNSFIGSIAFVAAARAAFIVTRDPDSEDPARRLFVQAKNNLAIDSGGLAFRVEQRLLSGDIVRSVMWEGERISRTADEILAANREASEKPERAEAEEFLQNILANGPRLATEIKTQAASACLSWRTVNRAKQDLGIIASARSEPAEEKGQPPRVQWWWSLPTGEGPRMPPDSQECHAMKVASLGDVGILGDSEGEGLTE